MICHQCNQDNIKIETTDDLIHITCDVCGLDIRSGGRSKFHDLFLYNRNLELAEKEGSEAYIEDKGSSDNPYSLESTEIMLNKRWEEGFDRERISYEKEAFSSSVENLNKEMEKMVRKEEDLEKENKELIGKKELYFSQYMDLLVRIEDLKDKNYIFGRAYRQDL